MPVTAQQAPQVSEIAAGRLIDSRHVSERTWARYFKFTQSGAGDQNSTADVVLLPAGRNKVLLRGSFIKNPAMTNGQIDVGHTGFTQPDGTVVAASSTAFAVNKATTSAGMIALDGDITFDYDSRDPLTVRITFDGTGGIADGAVLEGFIIGVRG